MGYSMIILQEIIFKLLLFLEKGVKLPPGANEKKSISLRLLGEANKKKDFKFP